LVRSLLFHLRECITQKEHTICYPLCQTFTTKAFFLDFSCVGWDQDVRWISFIYFVRMLLKHLYAFSRLTLVFITKNLVVKVGIWIFFWDNNQQEWKGKIDHQLKNFFFFKDMKLSWSKLSAHWSGGPSMRPCLIFEPTICFAC
jgi:hypothetical protein